MHYERFAPSPTGKLHLGHALSSFLVAASAKRNDGKFILRIEDLDRKRCSIKYENSIISDLKWLGLKWEEKPKRQSERRQLYEETLEKLWQMDILYKCECTRKDIIDALRRGSINSEKNISKPAIYPGICKNKKILHNNYAVRLDMDKATQLIDWNNLFFFNKWSLDEKYKKIRVKREKLETKVGDVILARRDIRTSYHIAVIADDSVQQISQVTRGRDLFRETFLHVLLQNLLQLPTPMYFHHNILCDDAGQKLSKSKNSPSIEMLRENGSTKEDVCHLAGLDKSLVNQVLDKLG